MTIDMTCFDQRNMTTSLINRLRLITDDAPNGRFRVFPVANWMPGCFLGYNIQKKSRNFLERALPGFQRKPEVPTELRRRCDDRIHSSAGTSSARSESFSPCEHIKRFYLDVFYRFSALAGGAAALAALPSFRIADSWRGYAVPLDQHHGHKARRHVGRHSIPYSATFLFEEFVR